MKQRTRIYYSAEQKALMWDRWAKGDTLHAIARLFNRGHSSIALQLESTGGIRPATRKRSEKSLTIDERETISRGLVEGLSLRRIASQLGRAPSTISREVSKNGGCDNYRAIEADKMAWNRSLRPKQCKLSQSPELVDTISRKLKRRWSPEQIAGWLMKQHPREEVNRVSHETIYRSLYIQARGVLKKELQQHLRTKRVMRRSRYASLKRTGQSGIRNAVPISERPACVEDRALPGHWEGDLIAGSKNSYIATLVERHSRYVMLAKVKNKDTESVINALIKQSKKLPNELYKSLTWDRGTEMGDHQRFTLATEIDVYLCEPGKPWQRGSNENTNRLLRQYFPKGTDISVYSQSKLSAVARQLNERPRKTLGYETPAERFNACVASTR